MWIHSACTRVSYRQTFLNPVPVEEQDQAICATHVCVNAVQFTHKLLVFSLCYLCSQPCACRVCICVAGCVCSRVCVCCVCVCVPVGEHMLSLATGWTLGTRSHSSLASIRLPNPATSNMGYMNLQINLMCNAGKKKGIFLLQILLNLM